MTTITSYTFEAAEYCVFCARERLAPQEGRRDEHGISETAVDSEGNLVRPRFASDEVTEDVFCNSCGGIIVEL